MAQRTKPAPAYEGPCRLCGGRAFRLCYTQGDRDQFRFHRCRTCRLVNADLAAGLGQTKYEATAAIDPLDPRPLRNRVQTQTYAFLRRHLRPPGRLLEIGCGNGRLLKLAADEGWSVAGIELSEQLAETARRRLGVTVRTADFLADEYAGGPFTVVVLRHVLEHLPDPRRALRRIAARLVPGGHALLEFPNIDAWDLRWKRALQRAGLHRKRYAPDYRPGHCNEFCRTAFEFLLAQTDFELIRWETYSYHPLANAFFTHIPVGNKARALIRLRECAATPAGQAPAGTASPPAAKTSADA